MLQNRASMKLAESKHPLFYPLSFRAFRAVLTVGLEVRCLHLRHVFPQVGSNQWASTSKPPKLRELHCQDTVVPPKVKKHIALCDPHGGKPKGCCANILTCMMCDMCATICVYEFLDRYVYRSDIHSDKYADKYSGINPDIHSDRYHDIHSEIYHGIHSDVSHHIPFDKNSDMYPDKHSDMDSGLYIFIDREICVHILIYIYIY